MSHHEDRAPGHGSIARLSKLPMPRALASNDNLKLSSRTSTLPSIHHDELRKTSHLPRPTGPISPLDENFDLSFRSRYGWTDKSKSSRNRSPVRDALKEVQSSALETALSNSGFSRPLFEAGNENPSNISPVLSPTTPRPDSPTKRPFRPPGRTSPTRDIVDLPPVSPGEIYTPPKAFVKGQRSRIAKPRELKRAASSVFEPISHQTVAGTTPKYSSQTVKARPTLASKPALSSMFNEPVPSIKVSKTLPVAGMGSTPALLKPRLRGENTLASATPPKANSKAKRATIEQQDPSTAGEAQSSTPAKSSTVLRETIAKAKAGKWKIQESAGPTNDPVSESQDSSILAVEDGFFNTGDSQGLLRRRAQQATTTGSLMIAAMNLKTIPPEVMNMYDPEYNTTTWAEMVALTKMNAADNQIEVLGQEMFPSIIDEDDEKSGQFRGLEVIDLHRNLLQQIPHGLVMLEQLHTLNLSGNKLTKHAFNIIGRIPNLKELFIADNNIQGTLDLDFPEQLEVLDMHNNAVSSLGERGLSKLRNLRILNLGGNKLSALDWSAISMATLTELNFSQNQLCGTLFSAGQETLPELRSLDASFNNLESLVADAKENVNSFPNMRTLNLTGNKLSRLPPLRELHSLVTLEVADNNIAEIPAEFGQLAHLKGTNFGNNNIRIIPAEIATMHNLTSFSLVGNPLREKKYLTMDTTDLKLELERKLDLPAQNEATDASTVGVSPSRSQYRFTPLNGTLDLSSQSLSMIPLDEIDLPLPVHTLKLSNNELITLPVELLAHPSIKYSLASLDLSHNPSLQSCDYLTTEIFLPNLKSLYIVSTGLTSLDGLTTYLHAPELREINISCHRLAGHVPWVRAWWPKVTILLATDNWFSSVDVEGVRGLECLDIRNNEVEHLPPRLGLLGNLPDTKDKCEGRLRVLEVSGNKFRVPRLAVVEKGTEAVLKDLRRMVKEEEITDEWKGVL